MAYRQYSPLLSRFGIPEGPEFRQICFQKLPASHDWQPRSDAIPETHTAACQMHPPLEASKFQGFK
jgi:hypothetical protein